MYRHSIDICPDDPEELTSRLDTLAEAGSDVINVIWQPRRVQEGDQQAAFDTSGSFLIISRRNAMVDAVAMDQRAEGVAAVA
jgi:hypothetical protein